MFNELLLRNRGRFIVIARSFAREEVDDLLQEILLQIWRSLDRFAGESALDTWCYRVALNTAISWRRTTSTRQSQLPVEPAELEQLTRSVAGSESDPHELQQLEQFIDTLPKTERGLLLMYLDGLGSREMSEITGISEGAIRVRIHRLKQQAARWNDSREEK